MNTTTPPNHRRRWTPATAARLRWEAETYIGDANYLHRLAARFGRTPHACRAALRRHYGWTYCGATGYLTIHQVAVLLGVSAAALQRLLERGAFIPGLSRHDGPKPYRITYDALWDWLTDMRSWHVWTPARLADPAMRAHFSELRRGWLNSEQVADMLCLSTDSVHRLRREGRLPGAKPTPRSTWFRDQDVLAFRSAYFQEAGYAPSRSA